MISIINLFVLLVSSIGFGLCYILSIKPTQMERTKGAAAYKLTARYRVICSAYMGIAFISFVLYSGLLVPFDPFPPRFPWSYWISLIIALALGIPATFLMLVAVHDAGKETLSPM